MGKEDQSRTACLTGSRTCCSSARTATARPRTSPEGGWCARSARSP